MLKRTIFISVAIIGLLTATFFILPEYSRTALINRYPGIYDHKIFHNNIVKAKNPFAIDLSSRYNKYILNDNDLDSLLLYDPVSLIVLSNDSIIFEKYFNEHNSQTLSNSFSITKSIVSLLVGCALDDGHIKSLSQPVTDFIPELKHHQGFWDELTLEQLLQMQSGLDFDETYTSLFSPTTKAYYGKDLKKQVMDLKFKEKPGGDFEYLSINTQIIGMILRAAVGKSLADYATEKLWIPIEAEIDAIWYKDREDGIEKAYCCFSATSRDFARIGMIICDSGAYKGKKIIPYDYFARMISGSSDDNSYISDENFYGYHWWLTKYQGLDVIYARGILGQYIVTIPEKRLVLVRKGNKRSEVYIGKHPSDLFLYLRIALDIADVST